MSKMEQAAKAFFEGCEAGKGWDECKAHCKSDATFSCQADALAEVRTIQSYADWMKGLFGAIPDGAYSLKALGFDNERKAAIAAAVYTETRLARADLFRQQASALRQTTPM